MILAKILRMVGLARYASGSRQHPMVDVDGANEGDGGDGDDDAT